MTKKEENKKNRINEEEVAYETSTIEDYDYSKLKESLSSEQDAFFKKFHFYEILEHFKGRDLGDVQSVLRKERDES